MRRLQIVGCSGGGPSACIVVMEARDDVADGDAGRKSRDGDAGRKSK